jgi:hypothetical protein
MGRLLIVRNCGPTRLQRASAAVLRETLRPTTGLLSEIQFYSISLDPIIEITWTPILPTFSESLRSIEGETGRISRIIVMTSRMSLQDRTIVIS